MRILRSTLVLAALLSVATGLPAQRRARRPPSVPYERAGPDVGDRAPDLAVWGPGGEPIQLADLWADRPLILVLGSYTSPEFRETVDGLERLAGAFGVRIRTGVLYTLEAHPKGSKSPYGGEESAGAGGVALEQPVDLEGRRAAARLAMEKLPIRAATVVVDGMDNAAWNAYGPAPNNAFLIDRGYVVERQPWFDPVAMDAVIRAVLQSQPPLEVPEFAPPEKAPPVAPAEGEN